MCHRSSTIRKLFVSRTEVHFWEFNFTFFSNFFPELSNEKILAVYREWSSTQLNAKGNENAERLRTLKDQLTMNLSTDNYTTLV